MIRFDTRDIITALGLLMIGIGLAVGVAVWLAFVTVGTLLVLLAVVPILIRH